MMIIGKRIVAIVLILCFFLNATAVFATDFYNGNPRVETVSAVEEEKERLKKKFTGMKEWAEGLRPYESFIAKNQTFLKFKEEISKFLSQIRKKIDEQLNKNFTTL